MELESVHFAIERAHTHTHMHIYGKYNYIRAVTF